MSSPLSKVCKLQLEREYKVAENEISFFKGMIEDHKRAIKIYEDQIESLKGAIMVTEKMKCDIDILVNDK